MILVDEILSAKACVPRQASLASIVDDRRTTTDDQRASVGATNVIHLSVPTDKKPIPSGSYERSETTRFTGARRLFYR